MAIFSDVNQKLLSFFGLPFSFPGALSNDRLPPNTLF